MYSRPMGKVALLKAHFVTPNLRTTRDLSYLSRSFFAFSFSSSSSSSRFFAPSRFCARVSFCFTGAFSRKDRRETSVGESRLLVSWRKKQTKLEGNRLCLCYIWRRELPPLWPAPPRSSSARCPLLAPARFYAANSFSAGDERKAPWPRADDRGTAKRENISLQMYVFWAYFLSMRDYSQVT